MITSVTALMDRAAIGLSALCAIHCLALPVALVLLPSIASLPIADEHFHLSLVFVVIPTSVCALTLGCRRHGHMRVVVWGLSGISVLGFAAIFGHDLLNATSERILTLIGAAFVVIGHVQNFKLCQAHACEPEACGSTPDAT